MFETKLRKKALRVQPDRENLEKSMEIEMILDRDYK